MKIRKAKYEGKPHGLFQFFSDAEMIRLQKKVEATILPEVHDKEEKNDKDFTEDL